MLLQFSNFMQLGFPREKNPMKKKLCARVLTKNPYNSFLP